MGIVMVDFVDGDVAARIIALNEPLWTRAPAKKNVSQNLQEEEKEVDSQEVEVAMIQPMDDVKRVRAPLKISE